MTPPPSPEPPKPSLEELITDWVYKILMVGGVGAGGAGAFWQLFKVTFPKRSFRR